MPKFITHILAACASDIDYILPHWGKPGSLKKPVVGNLFIIGQISFFSAMAAKKQYFDCPI